MACDLNLPADDLDSLAQRERFAAASALGTLVLASLLCSF